MSARSRRLSGRFCWSSALGLSQRSGARRHDRRQADAALPLLHSNGRVALCRRFALRLRAICCAPWGGARKAALVAERVAIRDEKPRFNVVGLPKLPRQSCDRKQVGLALPDDVLDWLKSQGEANVRSMASEVVVLVRVEIARREQAPDAPQSAKQATKRRKAP
jgi:hypothetical protein